MSYLSVDNLIGVQPTTSSSTLLQANIVDVYNGTTNYHHITSASTTAPNNVVIPDANGEFVLTSGSQTIQSKMFHSPQTSSFAPVYSFQGDTQTGMYWSATNTIGFCTDAIEQVVISPSNVISILPIKTNQFRSNSASGSGYGTAGNVVYGLDGGTNGMYFGLNRINFSTNSAERLNIQDASMNVSVRTFYPDGTTALPSISFTNANTTGFSMIGANRISVSAAGSNVFTFSNGGLNYSALPLVAPNGTVATGGIVGNSYQSTGLYWTAGPILNVSVGGTQRVAFESSGVKLYGSTAGNNALYVPSGLQYYEELTGLSMVLNWGNQSQTATLNITRIGRQIFMQLQSALTFSAPSTAQNQISCTTLQAIPVRFRPAYDYNAVSWSVILQGGTYETWYNSILTTGQLFVSRMGATFTSSITLYTFSATWTI